MTIPQGKISGKAVLKDIRAGMNNNFVMKKYQLSGEQLKRVLKKLLNAGALSRSEYDNRVPPEPKKLTPSFRCSACGATHIRRFIRCPSCGVKVPSFRYEDSSPSEVHELAPPKDSGDLCWFCGKEPPSRQAVLVKTLIANYRANPDGRITFDDTSVEIPRCMTCRSNHIETEDLEEALEDLVSQIRSEGNDPAPLVPIPTERAHPVTVIAAVCAGLLGLWVGLHGAGFFGVKNVWLQLGLGILSGLVLLGVVFVAADSWLMPRLRRARLSSPENLPQNQPANINAQGVLGEQVKSMARLELLQKRRDLLQEEKAQLLAYTKPESEWVEFGEAMTLLQTGWDYNLDRPGLSALKLSMDLAALSKQARPRGKD